MLSACGQSVSPYSCVTILRQLQPTRFLSFPTACLTIVFLLCVIVTAVGISFVHAFTARLKIEQIFKYYWTVVSALALLSLVLVWYGL